MASTYLARTPGSASNRQIFTFSFWVKRARLGYEQYLYCTSPSNAQTQIVFTGGDVFGFDHYTTGYDTQVRSTQVFRDDSAWYHFVVGIDTTQATSSNRVKLYVNGSQITDLSASTYPSQNYQYSVNNTVVQNIGRWIPGPDNYYDGCLSNYYLIDGQQLDPSYFGQTDTTTGIWKPKSYSGSYGTNGFFLKFENSGSLGTDSSGNGNNWTVNGTPTQTVDTPTNNFAILNTLDNQSASGSGTLANGNTHVAYTGGGFRTRSTIGTTKGKWYWEVKALTNTNQGFIGTRIGFVDMNDSYNNNSLQTMEGVSFGMYVHPTAGVYRVVDSANTLVDANLTYTNNDIISLALDCDNNISYWYKNGSLVTTFNFSSYASVGQWILTPTTGNSSGSASPTMAINYGNGYFQTTAVSGNYADGAGYGKFQYQPRTGHYALCTRNLNTYG